MASTSGSEFVVNSAAETSQNVDLVFVDEDEMPLTSVAIGTAYLERESDEEIDSYFYQTDSEAEESDENEELQQAGPPRKRRRTAQGENDVVGDPVWVEDIRMHSDLPFTQPTGPKVRMGADQKDPVSYFCLFFTDALLDLVVTQTNLYAAQERAKTPDKHRMPWHAVDKDEIRTFIALILAMGLVNKPTIHSYWSTDEILQTPFFTNCMSRNRFTQILRYIHFVNNTQLIPRGQDGYDKLGKIRPFLELIKNRFQRVYAPSRNLSVDETLVKFKGRLSWRQFMRDKPARFGLKEFTLADSENGYVLDINVYTGKECGQESKGLAQRVVLKLVEPFYGLGYNIFMDNYYTSVQLFEKLYDQGLQACGTCRGNRIGLPRDVTTLTSATVKRMKHGEAIFRQKHHLTCVTWKDRKPVTILTTLPANEEMGVAERSVREANVWHRRDFACPIPVQQYNLHMGGVDVADQRTTAYARLMKGWTWYLKLFYHFLEVSVLNAYLVYCKGKDDDQPDLSMMDFRILVIRGLHGGRSYKITPTAAAPQISRLNLSLGHFPVKVDKRCAFKVHLQRVLTSYKCGLCGVHMCPSPCFEKYHTLQDYLYDDPEYGAATPRLKPQNPGRPFARGRPRQMRQ